MNGHSDNTALDPVEHRVLLRRSNQPSQVVLFAEEPHENQTPVDARACVVTAHDIARRYRGTQDFSCGGDKDHHSEDKGNDCDRGVIESQDDESDDDPDDANNKEQPPQGADPLCDSLNGTEQSVSCHEEASSMRNE